MNKKLLLVSASMLATMLLASCGGTKEGTKSQDTQAPTSQSSGAAQASQEADVNDQDVKSIAVKTMPKKVEYYVDETFSAEGGILAVTYNNGSTAEVPLTHSKVTLVSPDMSKVGNKTITVTFGGKRTRFSISVKNQGFKVSVNLNYEGAEVQQIDVTKGKPMARPTDPTREGHAFYDWYQDKDCTVPFDFDTLITADTTIYACWKENGATYFEATYDINYYGDVPATFIQIVKSGEAVRDLGVALTRTEYNFLGWAKDKAGDTAFTNKVIEENTTIYAKWQKTKSGVTTYTFEAENTDLTGKTGPGFSGSAQEGDMVVGNVSASAGKAVSYLYQRNNSLEFRFASDMATSDAKIVLSLAAEMDNINFDSNSFQVLLNGNALSYAEVRLPNDNTFADRVTIEGNALKEGENLLQLKVNNSTRPLGDASTYAATAPMVDCVKIDTEATLIYDANYGLPMEW